MPSPFPANCELTFQVGISTGDRDLLGNPIITQKPFKFIASVAIDSDRQDRVIAQPGDDLNIAYFVGRCITPKFLPGSIRVNSKAQCKLKDLASGVNRVGEFTVTMVYQSRWAPVANVLGSKFEGYLLHA